LAKSTLLGTVISATKAFINATVVPLPGIGSPTVISAKRRVPMYNIVNTLPEQIRSRSVGRLNRHLAAAIFLHALVRRAQPNVRGPTIIAFDELFDKVADALREYSDKIAERAGTVAARRMAAPGRLEPFNGIPPRTGFGRVPTF
jgi:hypothetical protein